MKEQDLAILKEQMAENNNEYRDKVRFLEDQLETEQENGIKLERVENQRDNMQKVINEQQEILEQCKELNIELVAKTNKINKLEKEVAATAELQSVITLLRNDLSDARKKCTHLEL